MARIYKRPNPPLPPAPEVDDLKEGVHTVFQSPDVGQKTRTAHTRAYGNGVPSDPSLGWGESRMRETTEAWPKLTRFELIDEMRKQKEFEVVKETNELLEELYEIYRLWERWGGEVPKEEIWYPQA